MNVKRFVIILLLCTLPLSACTVSSMPAETQAEQTVPAETFLPAETPAATSAPVQVAQPLPSPEESKPAETEPAETEPAESAAPGTVRLLATLPIYDGPGYEHNYVRAVGQDSLYTIAERLSDADGHTWGRLKSGLGWVDLTAAASQAALPLSLCFADELATNCAIWGKHVAEESEYTSLLAFRADEELKNIRFISLQYGEHGYEPGTSLHTLDRLPEGQFYVLGVVFYGDMTAYGISFTDASGNERHFAASISGRDGTPVLVEYRTK